ncbi:MAG: hypothetical protein UU11_C0002G0141 [Parcubacteria group bacterium GW2011_GWF2_40_69]|nr:MAG: hypothetical protein UT25_C0002G0150 [Parcubacteria group bacterium GW2011_GWC1_39_12]KKR19350.1 MAG: hypothetical protein UT49_C0002G0196 [Parcubacteria group bacterium GW2011_GWF1_39_37]KKR35267.1 MAG: hypothetical protein UT68_C0004G0075 [Parcubacteria group bacterium GW2011_GWC2_40_10]KKR52300.1 MAG: hypothetical protein UT89_C0002G0101 [Parcubacteria group bacterium GW2011_GWE1_40_20]KKR69343.1 MAG: hypothetical protein UU11_C0002G0141 [Parcubacteria group bacterium GW2011_GWF2_40_
MELVQWDREHGQAKVWVCVEWGLDRAGVFVAPGVPEDLFLPKMKSWLSKMRRKY